MIAQPLLVVRDVEASRRWYEAALGLVGIHGGSEYERLAPAGGGDFVLQLHAPDAHDHDHLFDAARPLGGNGVALWWATDAFDAAVARLQGAGIAPADGPLHNERAGHREVWLRDPDGYLVVIAG